jgi:tetratricopeptide (TPR) repeat protein
MMQAGALEVPMPLSSEVAEPVSPVVTLATEATTSRRAIQWSLFAVAASLLFAAWLARQQSGGSPELLAQARSQLAAGNTQQALQHVNALLQQSLNPEAKNEARRFQKNLQIQSDRQIDAEYALDQRGTLEVYASTKSLTVDPLAARYASEFEQALAEFPDDTPLRLNYGQLLLEQGNYSTARQQFEKVLVADNRNPRARLGLGLAVVLAPSSSRTRSLDKQTDRDEQALAQFEMVLEVMPENVAAHINAAICLSELPGRTGEALKYWQRAAELTTSEAQRHWIEGRMAELEAEKNN